MINHCNIYHCIQSEDELEIFRLSTDKEYRKAGVASKLVAKIERVAAVLKCTRIKASTSSAQESALKFYTRNSWTEVWECLNYKEYIYILYIFNSELKNSIQWSVPAWY